MARGQLGVLRHFVTDVYLVIGAKLLVFGRSQRFCTLKGSSALLTQIQNSLRLHIVNKEFRGRAHLGTKEVARCFMLGKRTVAGFFGNFERRAQTAAVFINTCL